MNQRELLDALLDAQDVTALEAALAQFRATNLGVAEKPVGRRPNNRGAIEVATDQARSVIERVTNAQDALLELEHQTHNGQPECRSPRDAASAWLQVPATKGLAGLSNNERQQLAQRIVVRLDPGEGVPHSRLISVFDDGIGIEPERLQETILSLNESNKISKHYLAGTYGQGGSSTYAFSRYTVIISRHHKSEEIAFTVVRYLDLPAEEFKSGHYVYLTLGDAVLSAPPKGSDTARGTIVRHFGFDLSNYPQPIGPKSVYGALQRLMFDPIAPVRLENKVHGWNRVIKGVRNALNGAVDQGDDGKGPELDHSVPLFSVQLGEFGSIGIEYWLLRRPGDDKASRKNPSDAFVDSRKPIVLSHNGQNQGELSGLLIRRDSDLPYLRSRLIVHVNCDNLSPHGKRMLFASTREHSREGYLLNRIEKELVALLRADDELKRLNEAARDATLKEKDESTKQQLRKQVAKLLQIHGRSIAPAGGLGGRGDDAKQGGDTRRGARTKPQPIAPQDPPTFIRVMWDDEKPIPFYEGQRRYLRVETDADGSYHTPDKPQTSRINIAVGGGLKVVGTSPLIGGRMRVGIECTVPAAVGTSGALRIELYRHGHSTLSDERSYLLVEQPALRPRENASDFPAFDIVPVEGPGAADWEYISDDESDADPAKYASNSLMNEGTLYVYYSEAFPRFATELKKFEQQDPALSKSFRSRYEVWLVVHALLRYQDDQLRVEKEGDSDSADARDREERTRVAMMAAIVAAQDVRAADAPQAMDIEG